MSTCVHCAAEINPQTDYRRVLAWERKAQSASRRGGSDIVLREPTGVDLWSCMFCIERLKRGVSVEQESLLGDAA